MRSWFFLPLVLWAAMAAGAAEPNQASKARYHLNVVTGQADALYHAGDEVGFIVTLNQGEEAVTEGELTYVLDNDGAEPKTNGKLSLSKQPLVIRGTLDKPGFLRCQVTYRPADVEPVRAMAAAAIDPLEIGPSLPVPDDFDDFWSEQKRKLAEVPLEPKLTPVKSPAEGIECFDVEVACVAPRPVSGYFARPAGAEAKSLPAILHVHGAGVRGSVLSAAVEGAKMGMLSLDINAHGIPNGKPAAFYDELTRGELAGYRHDGRENRETCYFLGMFLRLVRAIDFLASQPEWDGQVMIVEGHSQGGGQSIAAAGLDPRVTFIAAGVPAICDHSGAAVGRINGWPKLVPLDDSGKPDSKIQEAARYFDAMNFAARTKADAIFSIGFIDATCPPTTNYATYNNLEGRKRVINEPLMGHAAPPHIQSAFGEAIHEHVRQVKGGQ